MNSSRQPEDHEKRAIEAFGRVCIERSQHLSDTVSPQRVDLVRHDLRPKPQAIARGGLHHRSQAMRRGNLRRHRANKNGSCRVAQLVSLDDDTRTRLAHVALGDDKHHIAAFQDQSSGSSDRIQPIIDRSVLRMPRQHCALATNFSQDARIAQVRHPMLHGTQSLRAQAVAARSHALLRSPGFCLFRGRGHGRNVTCYDLDFKAKP